MRRCLITALSVFMIVATLTATKLSAQAPQGKAGKAFRGAGQQRPMPKAEWLDPDRTAPNGTQYKTFTSQVLGREVSYLLYLPPGYAEGTRRYPVIYWLHGMGGNQRAGAMVLVPRLDAAIRKGELPPAIVVLPNGMVRGFYCDAENGNCPVESVIIKDLIPHIDKTCRTLARREGRVIQGFSMGGYGAGHLGFKYPELFGTVIIDAGALIAPDAVSPTGGPVQGVFGNNQERRLAEHPYTLARKNADKLRGQTQIRVGVGSLDSLAPRNQQMHEILQQLGIDHQYEVAPGVAHDSGSYYKTLGPKCFAIHKKVLEALGETK